MQTPDFDDRNVSPFQRVAHGVGGPNVPRPAMTPGLLQELAAQLGQTVGNAGVSVHVHIRRLRVIVADPATLRAAGLHQQLGAGPQGWDGWDDGRR